MCSHQIHVLFFIIIQVRLPQPVAQQYCPTWDHVGTPITTAFLHPFDHRQSKRPFSLNRVSKVGNVINARNPVFKLCNRLRCWRRNLQHLICSIKNDTLGCYIYQAAQNTRPNGGHRAQVQSRFARLQRLISLALISCDECFGRESFRCHTQFHMHVPKRVQPDIIILGQIDELCTRSGTIKFNKHCWVLCNDFFEIGNLLWTQLVVQVIRKKSQFRIILLKRSQIRHGRFELGHSILVRRNKIARRS